MDKPLYHIFSYLAALVIGMILFTAFWKTLFGAVSSPVVIAGITGVALSVIFYLVLNYRNIKNDDNK
jgi:tetrahydromethanopterin S-methyltransferase subunit E